LHTTFQVQYLYDYIMKLCRHKQRSYKIKKVKMFATTERPKPDTKIQVLVAYV
jgi:hypothetical protein